MKLTSIGVLSCLLIALVGCTSMEKKVVGKWTGKVQMTEEQKKDDPSGMGAAMVENMSFNLDLKEDKTFTATMIFPVEGTWALDDGQIALTPTKIMGMDTASMGDEAKSPRTINIEDGGAKLTMKLDRKDSNSPTILYTKSEE